jgi:hypothetical protein
MVLRDLLINTFKLHENILFNIFGDDLETLRGYFHSMQNQELSYDTLTIVISDILAMFRFEKLQQFDPHSNRMVYVFEDFYEWHNKIGNFQNLIFRIWVDMKLKTYLVQLTDIIKSNPPYDID